MKKNQVEKIHIFIIKYLESKRQLSQMAVHINSTHEYLADGDSQSANSMRAKERDDKWFFLSLSTRTALASALARDSLTRNSLSLSPELTGFRLACLLYL